MGSLADLLTVAIGLVVVYLMLSIITSYLQEWIATLFNMRASNLASAIHLLLEPSTGSLVGWTHLKQDLAKGQSIWNKGLKEAAGEQLLAAMKSDPLYTFYTHPVIKTLAQPGKLPSYISSGDFATALFDIFMKAGTQPVSEPAKFLDGLETAVNQLGNTDLKMSVLPYIQNARLVEGSAETQIAAARKNIEGWFNSTMDRASGWYKRRMQIVSIVLSFALVLVFNVDTFAIVQSLWHDSGLRASVNALAETYANQNKTPDAEEVLGQLGQLYLPLGWSGRLASSDPKAVMNPIDFPVTSNQYMAKLLGLLVSAIAVSQGSAVWFDALGKLINLRSSGNKPALPAAAASEKG